MDPARTRTTAGGATLATTRLGVLLLAAFALLMHVRVIEVKLGAVLLGLLLFVRTAHVGRPRLARNCLLLAACIGMLRWTSNLVG